MKESFIIKKVLNNNVLIATHPSYRELVLIGKGIGFSKKKGDVISKDTVEKMFILKNENEQEHYMKLLPHLDEKMIAFMNEVIFYIKNRINLPLSEHIHIALTDHLSFAIRRTKQGMDLKNPFLVETKALYPEEYQIAEEVIKMVNDHFDVHLPEGEIGFVALHIHSAISNKQVTEASQYSQLIRKLTSLIEHELKLTIDRESVNYLRLVRHLKSAIKRVQSGEKVEEPSKLSLVLKEEYPVCYNLAWKIIKIMQQSLEKTVYDAEAVYLTLHLHRLVSKTKS